MLEKMEEFFDNRIDGYEEHMLSCIESAKEFYEFTAQNLPRNNGAKILDLGCGTGLELDSYFPLNPDAEIVGIDLSEKMLEMLRKKFNGKNIKLINGSYFDVPFGKDEFDGAVSVESLHHFTLEEKIPLYSKLYESLKENSVFILTDYFSLTNEEERAHRAELIRIKKENGLSDTEFYHYDTPLTVEHEISALKRAGFCRVEMLKTWGQTATIKSTK